MTTRGSASLTIDLEDWYHIPSVCGSTFSEFQDVEEFFVRWDGRYDYLTDTTGRVLQILDHYRVPATFFVVADVIEHYPGLVESIVDHGQPTARFCSSNFPPDGGPIRYDCIRGSEYQKYAEKPLSGKKHCRCCLEPVHHDHGEQSGRGWLSGDSGEPQEYVTAMFRMWHDRRKNALGSRPYPPTLWARDGPRPERGDQ